VQGLEAYLRAETFDAVINATHPFAALMSANAAAACAAHATPLLRLVRPSWKATTGDFWISARDEDDAADKLADAGAARVFLTVGRQTLSPFTRLKDVWFLIRVFETPEGPLPFQHYDVVHDQPPFDAKGERALIETHHIDHLVTKNSGGSMTAAKLEAARAMNIPVVMIERPPQPEGDRVASIDETIVWVGEKV
jgi:precorrin-6A/cobalt-precorrin-6A reductase